MKLKTKLIIYIIFIHSIIILVAIPLLPDYPIWFIATEVLVLFSIIISIYFFQSFFRRLTLIHAGIQSIRERDFTTKFVTVGQNELDQLLQVYNQMIDKLREERVKQQEQHFFLDRLIQASPSAILILDFEERLTHLNPAAIALLGLDASQVIGKKFQEIPAKLAAELSGLQRNQAQTIRLNGIQTYKCQKAHFLDRGFQHYFILIEELTDEILKSERQAYEKVIRQMSHEINNSIGAVNSILNSILNFKTQIDVEIRDDYTNALQVAIDRNTHLNRFMANFADVIRLPAPMKQRVNLHQLLQSVQHLLSTGLEARRIKTTWHLASSEITMRFDAQQMEHVLVNILKNAMESIGENGEICIITRQQPFPHLVIQDNGAGIPRENQARLFTPFFSTKKDGQGIGLTLIREILLNHGYNFSLETKESGFTEFRIDFGENGTDT